VVRSEEAYFTTSQPRENSQGKKEEGEELEQEVEEELILLLPNVI
jgi:hypothetical protein